MLGPLLRHPPPTSSPPMTGSTRSARHHLLRLRLLRSTGFCSHSHPARLRGVATLRPLAITADADPSTPFSTILAKHRRCLYSGIAVVDDASFTTISKVHSDPTTASRSRPLALLDTGSLQTLISADEWVHLKTSSAATPASTMRPLVLGAILGTPPFSLHRLPPVRLSVQLLHGGTPSGKLAAWACIASHGMMQRPVLPGRDS